VLGAVRAPSPEHKDPSENPTKHTLNAPRFRPYNPLVKANMLPEDPGKNQNFLRTSLGRLDRLPPPPTRLDRPPWTEWEKQQPRVNPQVCITRPPDSPNELRRNFGDTWVTSWMTSPSKELHRNTLKHGKSQIS
jgi:hypothetical protein